HFQSLHRPWSYHQTLTRRNEKVTYWPAFGQEESHPVDISCSSPDLPYIGATGRGPSGIPPQEPRLARVLLLLLGGTAPAGRPGGLVVLAVGPLGRTTSTFRCLDTVGQAPSHHQKPGVADHPVVGSHRQSFDVPGAQHRLPRTGLVETRVLTQCFHHT